MVRVNGENCQADGKTVAEIVLENGYKRERVAVELNEKIVSKCDYDSTVARDGDCIEIVTFMGGG